MKTIINFANKVRSLVDGRMSNIANVEESPSTRAYAVGKQLIFNGLLCKATSAISVGDTLAVGTNLALADNVVEQIYSLNQGLTNSLANISHENLLDNPWFTVNQRGNNTYSESGYSVDRWKRNPSYENGHKFTVGTIEIPYLKGDFYQVIEKATNHWRHVPYTISAIIDGNLYSKTFTPYDDGQQHMGSAAWGSTSIGLDGLNWNIIENWSSSTHLVGINNNSASLNHTITAIKLELGSVSTLAMDTAPNYAEELLKCQRHFVRFSTNNTARLAFHGFLSVIDSIDTTKRDVWMAGMLPVVMRATPYVSSNDITKWFFSTSHNGNQLVKFLSTLNVERINGNSIFIVATVDNSNTEFGTYGQLWCDTANCYLDLSADL
jgi:hypothetical protein